MTVNELVAILATMPGNSRVVIAKEFEGGYNDVRRAGTIELNIDANKNDPYAGKHELARDWNDGILGETAIWIG